MNKEALDLFSIITTDSFTEVNKKLDTKKIYTDYLTEFKRYNFTSSFPKNTHAREFVMKANQTFWEFYINELASEKYAPEITLYRFNRMCTRFSDGFRSTSILHLIWSDEINIDAMLHSNELHRVIKTIRFFLNVLVRAHAFICIRAMDRKDLLKTEIIQYIGLWFEMLFDKFLTIKLKKNSHAIQHDPDYDYLYCCHDDFSNLLGQSRPSVINYFNPPQVSVGRNKKSMFHLLEYHVKGERLNDLNDFVEDMYSCGIDKIDRYVREAVLARLTYYIDKSEGDVLLDENVTRILELISSIGNTNKKLSELCYIQKIVHVCEPYYMSQWVSVFLRGLFKLVMKRQFNKILSNHLIGEEDCIFNYNYLTNQLDSNDNHLIDLVNQFAFGILLHESERSKYIGFMKNLRQFLELNCCSNVQLKILESQITLWETLYGEISSIDSTQFKRSLEDNIYVKSGIVILHPIK